MSPDEASRVQVLHYQQMSSEVSLSSALRLHELTCAMAREGIRRQHTDASEEEVEHLLRGRLSLVAICTEFGRTPWGGSPHDKGRNHHAKAFTCMLAGAGVRGGTAYGKTDAYGINIVSEPCHVHDYHATILHLMGVDHKRLTYRFACRDFRLTDVHGNVLHPILT